MIKETFTLGNLIWNLDLAKKGSTVRFDFCGLSPAGFRSWRGSYDQLALGWSDEGPVSVARLLQDAKNCLGKPFLGYKGGEYTMNLSTRVWVDNWGEYTRTGIVSMDITEHEVLLRTARIEAMTEPLKMLLWCPACGERHIDEDGWALKEHHTHACQFCGLVWRPAIEPTVGVRFLPGFKNEERRA